MLLTLILTLTLSHYLTISLFLTLTLFQSLIESLLTCWTTFVFISMLKSHSHTLTLTLSLSHTLSLSNSLNLSFNHSWHAEQVLFSCLGSKVAVYSRKLQWFFWTSSSSREFWVHRAGSQLKIQSHTLWISHSITLDMLNNFCFHLYAQKSLFIGENCNGF